MYFAHLFSLGLATGISAQSLAAVLASNNATLSTLSNLLTLVPDLVQTLSTAQNVTILAPSNAAFANLMARNPRSAELTRNPRALAGVLQYHVLTGRLLSPEFTTTPKFPATLLSAPFANVTGGQRIQLAMVNNTARIFSGFKQMGSVVAADIQFDGDNIIHVIDTVLTVPASPGQTAINTGLTSLAGALTSTRLLEGINSLSDITIFAPSNDAFRAIGSALGSISTQDLATVLGYHVLTGRVRFSTELLAAEDQMVLPTLQGQNITVRRDGSQLFVNSAKVVLADIITANGVVHILDNVLNPSNTTATPDPSATVQAPAFSGVSSVATAPFTLGIVPTTTLIPATVPLNGEKKMKPSLPTPSQTFSSRKLKILSQLSVPDEEYTDLSPKGSVDVGIRDLIAEINGRDGLVTTSSCAGRVSVYLEGKKKKVKSEEEVEEISGSAVGGKGGGEWLFVSHDPVQEEEGGFEGLFKLGKQDEGTNMGCCWGEEEDGARLVHFKFEPMILHVLTASHEHAQLVIQAGMEAGFRETGAVSLLNNKEGTGPIVAVRSMGLSFESLVGVEGEDGVRRAIVSSDYLKMLVRISHERFAENQKRIARFRGAMMTAFEPPAKKKDWEDAETRRERKRLEGLRKREEMQKLKEEEEQRKAGGEGNDVLDVVLQQPDGL
ncbi:methyltransferase TYW3-domain-containing protein [Podospora fimiseda]|uniref:tRNA(Phe) 7-[(3-amino-3-carboxypropyl)-4-demethylwyosine(37)-N(4)]-methyltransferase n=1 Tax=Podospora fimiseda TaxID=252190 RepID=A0AAN7BZ62_9PEZI|nr:methyltransferase TYW3-domain-containing protein [Podospora fimiseda]